MKSHIFARSTTRLWDDISFSVQQGEIFGLLGPNGAGKTTTVECVVGLRTPDAGNIRVMGLDPQADGQKLRAIVGVQLQDSTLQSKLSVGEILDLYRSFYRAPADAEELIDVQGLANKLGDYYRSLSGGQKQRLSIALALIGGPKVAVLDEMTTGLGVRLSQPGGTSSLGRVPLDLECVLPDAAWLHPQAG